MALSDNAQIADALDDISRRLSLQSKPQPFKVCAYAKAAQNIRYLPVDIRQLAFQGCLRTIPGVGASIAAKVQQMLDTGSMRYTLLLEQ